MEDEQSARPVHPNGGEIMKLPDLKFGVIPGTYKKGGATVRVEDVAIYNEYGTEKIPPRPAFRRGLEHAVDANKKLAGAQLKNITQRILTGRRAEAVKSMTVLLTQIGRSAKAKTREIIKTGDETPNAPATVARKGFDHPLYETGVLLDSVDYEVTK